MALLGLHLPRETASLRQQVTDTLRVSILSGSLRPGQKLIERLLCEELLVSRTILREALQHLQAEGVIVSTPRRGLSVAKPDAQEANQMLRVRQALTPLVGEEFARNASNAQVARLRAQVDRLGDQNAMSAENKFYSILLEGCGNSVAGSMLALLNNRIIILQHLIPSVVSHRSDTFDELRGIVSAIEARDAELASRLCAAHVETGAANMQHERL